VRATFRSWLLALMAIVLVSPASVLANTGAVRFEAEEDGRLQLDGRGQANCVAEAVANAPTGLCASEPTEFEVFAGKPGEGFRILDAFVAVAGVSKPEETLANFLAEPTDALSPLRDYNYGMNHERVTDGLAPALIPPGQAWVRAWYGQWSDLDGDGIIRISADMVSATESRNLPEGDPGRTFRWKADNEWAPIPGAIPYVYIEPGSHPVVTKSNRPDENQPDITLEYRGGVERGGTGNQFDYSISGGGFILWVDGSLLQSMEMTTISAAILRPSEDGRFPFTPREGSLIDIDVYATVAPAPVASLYALAAPTVNAIGSPSVGSCPEQCRVSPSLLSDTPAAAVVGPLLKPLYAPYPREWADGSGSTASGRHADYLNDYHGWIDLLPMSAIPFNAASPRGTPLVGRQGDDPASAPGYLGFEAWTGVWKDRNADGFVGDAGDDPYRGGTRPLPDNYEASRAEFFGAYPVDPSVPGARRQTFNVTVRPLDVWPAGGVFLANTTHGLPIPHHFPQGCSAGTPKPSPLESYPFCVRVRSVDEYYAAGGTSTPLVMRASIDSALGRYTSVHFLLMPLGSQGTAVELCTERLQLPDNIEGLAAGEWLEDCDVLQEWSP